MPFTAFLRPVDAAQLQRSQADTLPASNRLGGSVNKWEILRELIAARAAFGLSDRDLIVLEALISFQPGTTLGGTDPAPVVHPSNATICERLKGMPMSTMRRHLARLVETGFVARRDSPNGKRYARRYSGEKVVFGLDLTPLITRSAEICAAADDARNRHERLTRLRETVSLMRRDLSGLAAYGRSLFPYLGTWDQCVDITELTARALRRQLTTEQLEAIHDELLLKLNEARNILEPEPITTNLSSIDAQSEHHYQNSNKELHESEPSTEIASELTRHDTPTEQDVEALDPADRTLPNIPLGIILSACAEVQDYSDGPIRHWHQLVRTADFVRAMTGISLSVWDEAKRTMGPEQASVVLAAMLERFHDIKSPGGYLRALTAKANAGAFSCAPMVMALLRRAA